LAQNQPGTTFDARAKEAELMQKAVIAESIVNKDEALGNPYDKDYRTTKYHF
jgi:hypothetical protein